MIFLDQNMNHYLRIGLFVKFREKIYEENGNNKIQKYPKLRSHFLNNKIDNSIN